MIVAVLSVTLMSVQAKLIGPEYHPIQIAFARGIVVLILFIRSSVVPEIVTTLPGIYLYIPNIDDIF